MQGTDSAKLKLNARPDPKAEEIQGPAWTVGMCGLWGRTGLTKLGKRQQMEAPWRRDDESQWRDDYKLRKGGRGGEQKEPTST